MGGFVPWWRRARYRTLTPPASGGDVEPPAVGVQALRAFDFWDGVGVNVHLLKVAPVGQLPNAYTDLPATLNALSRLNIRHMRTDSAAAAPSIAAINQAYADHGVKSQILLGKPESARPTQWPAALLDRFFTNGVDINAIGAFEAPNEQNLPPHNGLPANGYTEAQWATATRDHMAEAFASLNSVSRPTAWQNTPYVGWSYGNPGTIVRLQEAATVADWDTLCDVGNLHRYYPNNAAAGIATPLAQVRTYTYDAPGKPTFVTECGHHTLTSYGGGHRPTPEDAAGWYMPKLFHEWLRTPGITRAFVYELADEFDPAAGKAQQAFFGQYRYSAPGSGNWEFKPSGEALGNMLGLYKDAGGAAYAPGKLDYTVTASAPNLKTALHQRSTDGAFLLALWRDVNLWTWTSTAPPYGNYVTVADVDVTVDLGKTWATVEHRSPSNVVGAGGGSFLVGTLSGVSSVTVPVGKKLLVLVIK